MNRFSKMLRGNVQKNGKSRTSSNCLPAFESLESRQLMSVTLTPVLLPVTLAPAAPVVTVPLHPVPIFHFPDPIQSKYQAEGGASGFLGKSLGPETSTSQAGGTYEKFQGGNIYYSSRTGAHVVDGAILAEYNATAGETDFNGHNTQNDIGLPTSDEMNVPGVSGARENTFLGGAIYWSPATGAHVVYGSIYGHYTSIGGPKSYLGLPTGDEQAIPGGRESYFQNGKILFTPKSGAYDVATQSSLTFSTGRVNLDPVYGSATLSLFSDGSYDFSGHFHDSGLLSRNYSLVFGVRSPSGFLYTFTHSGHLAGSIESGSSDDNFDVSGKNPKIAAGWLDLQGSSYHWQADASTDLNSLINQLEGAAGVVLGVISIVV